ncbi:MAG: N-formylglutamate amidohydrolase [Planctomycetes bacterium]|nr:N-formylglutamate amidohydrolase [Planctomycetota bacterium]
MLNRLYDVHELDAGLPVLAVSAHSGHDLRPEVAQYIALDDRERRREEDPWTDVWTDVAGVGMVVHRSRFEVDFNRSRAACVYLTPEEAWGLQVWSERPSGDVVERSRQLHDEFFDELHDRLETLRQRHGGFVVLDLHSYNHRRLGPDAPCADPAANPEFNVGTGSLDRGRWGAVVDRFMDELSQCEIGGRRRDVRENIRFRGGYLPSWVNETFPECGCALAIEVKKFYMDEWSGSAFDEIVAEIGSALRSTVPGLIEALSNTLDPAEAHARLFSHGYHGWH